MEKKRGGNRRAVSSSYYDASKQYTTAPILDRAFSQQESSSSVTCSAANVRRRTPRQPEKTSEDPYAHWKPFSGQTEGCSGATIATDDAEAHGEDNDPNPSVEEPSSTANSGEKRKRYVNSDDPNSTWRLEAVMFLHELFRFDGLGDALAHPCCSQCGASSEDGEGPVRLFRCQDCHILLQCLDCCLDLHRCSPLHVLQEYNGTYFERVALSDLGLVYQLGHGGLPCDYPEPNTCKLTVLERNGIHKLSVRFCNCVLHHQPTHAQQLLRNGWYPSTPIDPQTCATFGCMSLFRLLNVAANVNARDFVTVLEKLTDALGISKVPDRYHPFGRMARQWNFLHRCKRSGEGFQIRSIADIPAGSLAVICWACPRLDFNLPKNWKKLDGYLFMPILALDANFRLKNKLRANERSNPSLAPGSAYFVDTVPYKKHLAKYVSEVDISTCIAFAALAEKDTKLTTGLKTSGVGACACARHEIIRPLGMGDLQKGERYANMDYILFSAIRDILLPRIALCYDIICQWKTNLMQRHSKLPPSIQLRHDVDFTFGLPTWHAVVHEKSCKSTNSLTYQEGVGRTDGEGIERIWSRLNPSGFATKEMGEGNRHDTLDDKVDYLNFGKNIGHGINLSRRWKAALEEKLKQTSSFEFADSLLDSEKRARWLSIIDAWKKDRSNPNPYLLPDSLSTPCEESVRKQLQELEEKEKQDGRTPIYGTSPSAFMMIGLQLEELQQSILRDSASKSRSAAKEMRLRERRETFSEMLDNFRQLQDIYMPGAIRAINADDGQPESSPVADNVKIWLPSDLSSCERITGCAPSVLSAEGKLRVARCSDALAALQQHLRTKQHLIAFRNANVIGQNDSSRARGLIDRVGECVDEAAEKYRRSRQALLCLEHTESSKFPELTAADVALDNDVDPDFLAIVKLGSIGSGSSRPPHIPTGKRTISWIWTAGGGPEDGTLDDECVRVEWSKALARKNRWTEEVEIVTEDMKRVLRSLDTKAKQWRGRMPVIPPERLSHPATAIEAGMRAYAARQADLRHKMATSFRERWGDKVKE